MTSSAARFSRWDLGALILMLSFYATCAVASWYLFTGMIPRNLGANFLAVLVVVMFAVGWTIRSLRLRNAKALQTKTG